VYLYNNFRVQFLSLIQVKNVISTRVQFESATKLWDFEMQMNKDRRAIKQM